MRLFYTLSVDKRMSSSSSDDRHFPNRFPSFSNENAREFFEFSSSQSEMPTAVRVRFLSCSQSSAFINSGICVQLSQDFHDQLVRVFDQLFAQWESDIDAYRTDDTTVYTGNGGTFSYIGCAVALRRTTKLSAASFIRNKNAAIFERIDQFFV